MIFAGENQAVKALAWLFRILTVADVGARVLSRHFHGRIGFDSVVASVGIRLAPSAARQCGSTV
jgi:hypothetical protein